MDHARPVPACRHTLSAHRATSTIDTGRALWPEVDRVLRANGCASPAMGAKGHNEPQFNLRGDALGVGAPPAGERAALQEDCGPYPRPIVDGVALDVRNECLQQNKPVLLASSRSLPDLQRLITPVDDVVLSLWRRLYEKGAGRGRPRGGLRSDGPHLREERPRIGHIPVLT